MGLQKSSGMMPQDYEKARVFQDRIQRSSLLLKGAAAELSKILWGQENFMRMAVSCIAAGGNLLVEGPTGTGKTEFASNLGTVLGLKSKRIQCTPDLMPPDVIGTEVLDRKSGEFKFIEGPAFTDILHVDEINRTGPKTQSAFLEMMEEKQITIAGEKRALSPYFRLIATQNPKSHHGTYPLLEAQEDRFMMVLRLLRPDKETRRRIVREVGRKEKIAVGQVMVPADLIEMKDLIDNMEMTEDLVELCSDLVDSLNPESKDAAPGVETSVDGDGPGTRASMEFARVAKACALFDGRAMPNIDDVKKIAEGILRHRTKLNYSADKKGAFEKILSDAMMHVGIK